MYKGGPVIGLKCTRNITMSFSWALLTHFDWGVSTLIFWNIVSFQKFPESNFIQARCGVALLPQPYYIN